MIAIEEITPDEIEAFWDLHIMYLIEDGIIEEAEDISYFKGQEYRGILEEHMRRGNDRHHIVYFTWMGNRIGAASYCIYEREGGQCFIMDFWVFAQYRNRGLGHQCFAALEAYTKAQGALFYELNSEKERAVHFWKSLGFVENGRDEYDMPLFVRRP